MHNDGSTGSYGQTAQSRYPATSSAFSPSAHPHEDWTKISDLAERRRIQNRIAQRNYRKKLKKRLEDLERKAASNSASPEQQPAQLERQRSPRKKISNASSTDMSREPSEYSGVSSSDSRPAGMLPLQDGPLFSEQFTRQLSTSPPPPFSFSMAGQDSFAYASYPSPLPYAAVPAGFPDPGYAYHPFPGSYPPSTSSSSDYPTKSEFYPEVDLHTFNMSFAPVPSIEISSGQPFGEPIPPQTPPLSECFESCCAGSPPESSFFATTPGPFESSPRMTMV